MGARDAFVVQRARHILGMSAAADRNGQRRFKKSDRILLLDQALFLTQKIEVGVTAGTRIDDGGKVAGKIVGVTACVIQGKGKGNLQRELGCSDDFSVFPRLTVNRDLAAGCNCIQERLAIVSKNCAYRDLSKSATAAIR